MVLCTSISTHRGSPSRRTSESGFTLAEVMIVVLIIGILLSVAVPTFVGARNRAHDLAALAHLNTAATAAIVVAADNGDFSSVTAASLESAEPSLTFIIGSAESTGPTVVSVEVSAVGEWIGVVRSSSGRCLAKRMTTQGRSSSAASSCAAAALATPGTPTSTVPATTSTSTTEAATTTTTAPSTTATVTTTTTAPSTTTTASTVPPCSLISVESFQQSSYTWTFQLRNTTGQDLAFEFVVPSANYQLTNVVFNGSGQNMAFTSRENDDGTFDNVVSGSLPAYQSTGGQQPNGFNGQVNPVSGQHFVRCQ